LAGTRVAVVLCGSGRADGSEIHESVACLIHLARLGAVYRCFAPRGPQADVVNHLTGEAMPESRDMIVESARIARGEVSALSGLSVEEFEGVVFPGGFGAAKNLCTFAKDGENCAVHPDVERVIRAFHAAGKPVGMCCIAPVMAARVLGTARGGTGVTVTVGAPSAAAVAVEKMGARHEARSVMEACIDETARVATAPAYMDDGANPWQVYEGIGRMIEATVRMAGPKSAPMGAGSATAVREARTP
jgi:enhancing lycopene biosynthesis protein 2